MSRWRFFATLAVLATIGCRTNAPEPPIQGIEAFGLVESPIDHPSLLASIRLAQLVLGPKSSITIVAGWLAPQGTTAVRVFAASPQGLSGNELMTSYLKCKCVIAQVGGMTVWLQKHTGTGQALLTIDVDKVLAYMLLHELGHIVHGDLVEKSGSFDTAVSATGFNLDLTQQKDRENAADRYAADAISTAMAARGTDRGLAGTAVAITLSQLSWNLAEHRLLDNFGGTELHHSSLFWDAGLSHPNLEWRILSVNDEISKTTVSHQMLGDFESSRHPEPLVLYGTPEP
jgi:hypothetical protein